MQVVQEFLTAVQTHNGEKMVALLHPNVKWNQPGKNRFAGQKSSRDDVLQMAGGMQEVAEKTLTLTSVKTVSANGNQVACLVHWKAVQPNGGILDVDNIDVYTVENGQIVNAMVFSADVAQEDSFWLK
ncbi:nuclear transport factor 2 family protein [Spirosoma areae]